MQHTPSEHTGWDPSGNEHFTGEVWNARLEEGHEGITLLGVQFAPGARSHWHSHPGGQTLYVISGAGLVQTEDGTTKEISAGDTVHAPPGEVHWHGAKPDSPLMHLALNVRGATEWRDEVSDSDYNRR
ncbi:MAG TPA: cupin domain-containing protein [Acidimicrobiia bacterium]